MPTISGLENNRVFSLMLSPARLCLRLRIQRCLHTAGKVNSVANAPVVQEDRLGVLAFHVVVDRDNVDSLRSQCLQHWLQLSVEGHEIAIDAGTVVAAP